jgi:outer membrane protein OmpA-like peptidoglycan-associated protein
MWVAGLMGAALIVGGLVLIQRPAGTEFGTVAVLVSEDANVAANGLESIRADVTDVAIALAREGGGRLVVVKASGGPARHVKEINLAIEGPDGQPEHDAQTIEAVAADRVEQAFDAEEEVAAEGSGRDVLGLLNAAAGLTPPGGQAFEVFLIGFGLGTVDPADARVQMGGDPGQAVRAMADRLPRLEGADLHLVFPAAVAPQEPPNVATAAWRRAYWQDIAAQTGARLVSVSDTNIKGVAAPGAARVPVIPNLTDPTPVPPQPIPPPDPQTPPPPTTLAGSLFLPDSPEFIDPAGAAAQLAPIAGAWAQYPGSYAAVACVGRTAHVGDPNSAIELSQQRADRAKAVLEGMGVTTVTATGVGFADPLPGIDPTDQGQRSVTCQLEPNP